jgi:acid phosphatase family membrane protein YuiD
MYDATGVRQAAGKHAKAINRIAKQLSSKNTFDDISLKELLGHTPIEVIAGALLGFFVAYIFTK